MFRYRYRAITCNFLPGTSKYYDTLDEAVDHIKKIIDEKEPWVTNEQIHISYRVDRIDERWFLRGKDGRFIKNVFPEREKTPVTKDYAKEKFRTDQPKPIESIQEQQLST